MSVARDERKTALHFTLHCNAQVTDVSHAHFPFPFPTVMQQIMEREMRSVQNKLSRPSVPPSLQQRCFLAFYLTATSLTRSEGRPRPCALGHGGQIVILCTCTPYSLRCRERLIHRLTSESLARPGQVKCKSVVLLQAKCLGFAVR